MAEALRFRNSVRHQGLADAGALQRGVDGERPEQQRRPAVAGRDVPQPDRTDEYAVVAARDKGEPLGRPPAAAQLLRRFPLPFQAHSAVEQRLARRRLLVDFGDDRERDGILPNDFKGFHFSYPLRAEEFVHKSRKPAKTADFRVI